MLNIRSLGLPEFIEQQVFFKRPEIKQGRVGTLFFNFDLSQKSSISDIEDKLNVFRVRNKW